MTPTKRVAIIGDVGGHLGGLKEQLEAVGVDVAARKIPADLKIIDVGDLVHKGPDSDLVVALVDELMDANPGRWIQLVGNHESQYLELGTDFWTPRVSDQTVEILRRWWATGAMSVAAAVDVVSQEGDIDLVRQPAEVLITHAGLTAGAWRLLGSPASAAEAADAINAAASQVSVAWREGLMITGVQDFAAGPMWAACTEEVYASWFVHQADGLAIPDFAQVHGHTNPYQWHSNRWRPAMATLIAEGLVGTVDRDRKIARIEVGDQVFWAIDPASGRTISSVTKPLTFSEQ